MIPFISDIIPIALQPHDTAQLVSSTSSALVLATSAWCRAHTHLRHRVLESWYADSGIWSSPHGEIPARWCGAPTIQRFTLSIKVHGVRHRAKYRFCPAHHSHICSSASCLIEIWRPNSLTRCRVQPSLQRCIMQIPLTSAWINTKNSKRRFVIEGTTLERWPRRIQRRKGS